jgi:hypothetical protein
MPQPTPMPDLAPALSPGSFVEPELSETSAASMSGVLVVAVGVGDVATEAGVLESLCIRRCRIAAGVRGCGPWLTCHYTSGRQ